MVFLAWFILLTLLLSHVSTNLHWDHEWDAIMQAQHQIALETSFPAFVPCIDGVLIPVDPLTLFRSGRMPAVDMLIGTTTDEGTTFLPPGIDIDTMTSDQYHYWLNVNFGSFASAVVSQYSYAVYGGYGRAYAHAFGDFFFICTARRLAGLAPASRNIYMYEFAHIPDWRRCPEDPNCGKGVVHTDDVFFTFCRAPPYPGFAFTANEWTLCTAMIRAWTSFAHTGEVTRDGVFAFSVWPLYHSAAQVVQVLNTTFPMPRSIDYRSTQCDFWDSLVQ